MGLTKVTYSMIEGAVFNVLDYGADPTGSNDSTAAINAAVAACAVGTSAYPYPAPPEYIGNTLVFPEGTYKISEGIVLNQAINVEGSGRVVITGNLTSATNKTAFYVGDVAYIGTNNGWISVSIKNLNFNLTNHNSCIYHKGVRNFRVENCVFQGGASESISTDGAWNMSWIKGCQFTSGPAKAIQIQNNSNAFKLYGNRIANYDDVAVKVVASSGVWIENNDWEYNYADLLVVGTALSWCYNIHIERNWFEGATSHSIKLDNTTYGFPGLTIRANKIYGDPDGSVYLGVVGGAGQFTGAIVDGNSIYAPATLYKNSISTRYVDTSIKNNYPDSINIKAPSFKVVQAGPQTIPSATYTAVNFGTQLWDNGNYYAGGHWSPATFGGGTVILKASISFSSGISAGDYVNLAIYKNGSILSENYTLATAASFGTLMVQAIDVCNGTSDYYDVYVKATNGGTINDISSETWFEGVMLDF